MLDKLNELKTLIAEAKKYHEASLDENAEEEATDAAYEEYWKRLDKIADLLVLVTGGRIDRVTALKMAIHKADKMLELVAKVA